MITATRALQAFAPHTGGLPNWPKEPVRAFGLGGNWSTAPRGRGPISHRRPAAAQVYRHDGPDLQYLYSATSLPFPVQKLHIVRRWRRTPARWMT